MKVIAISDTHLRHYDIKLPDGDLLIHAGDLTSKGTRPEVIDFLEWFSRQKHQYKVFIAGNHDFFFESNPEEIKKLIPDNLIYLENEGLTINGVNIWGSPVQPWFHDWAFNRARGEEIRKYWDLIPSNTDILITHGPPYGILDKTRFGKPVGCEELAVTLQHIKPKYHIFGHIHEAYGSILQNETHYINASLLNERYVYTNDPVVFEI